MSMNDGGMVAPSEGFSNLGQRVVRQLAGQIHSDLPRKSDSFGAFARFEILHAQIVVFPDLLLNISDGDHFGAARRDNILQRFSCQMGRDILIGQRRVGNNPD
ncbi:hypothetical protein D3C80_1666200 [compost metagenome]